MKTLEERAKEFVDKLPLGVVTHRAEIEREFIKAVKGQDKETRHLCADNVEDIQETVFSTFSSGIDKDRAISVIINTKAV